MPDDVPLAWLLPILQLRATLATTELSHPTATLQHDDAQLEVGMTRVEIERGLGDGTLVKGVTERTAEGDGDKPPPGHLLLPDDVDKVWPLPRGREVVGWLVVGPGYRWSARVTRWRVPVVAVGCA